MRKEYENNESFLFKVLFVKWRKNLFFTLSSLSKPKIMTKKKIAETNKFVYKDIIKNSHNVLLKEHSTSSNEKSGTMTSRMISKRPSKKSLIGEPFEILSIYISNKNKFVVLEENKHGSFFDDHCYIVVSFKILDGSPSLKVYFWKGRTSSSLYFPLFKFDYLPSILRSFKRHGFNDAVKPILVQSHQESVEFLSIFRKNFALYTSKSSFSESFQMFSLFNINNPLPLKFVEISPPSLASLNSKHAYYIRQKNNNFLWLGGYLVSFNSSSTLLSKDYFSLPYFYGNKTNTALIYEGKESKGSNFFFLNILLLHCFLFTHLF